MYKRFEKGTNTVHSLVGCPCLCSCIAVGCTVNDANTQKYINGYKSNSSRTSSLMYNADRG